MHNYEAYCAESNYEFLTGRKYDSFLQEISNRQTVSYYVDILSILSITDFLEDVYLISRHRDPISVIFEFDGGVFSIRNLPSHLKDEVTKRLESFKKLNSDINLVVNKLSELPIHSVDDLISSLVSRFDLHTEHNISNFIFEFPEYSTLLNIKI